MKKLPDGTICTCMCHTKGSHGVMHCVPCCSLTSKQYVNTDGSIDLNQYISHKGLKNLPEMAKELKEIAKHIREALASRKNLGDISCLSMLGEARRDLEKLLDLEKKYRNILKEKNKRN